MADDQSINDIHFNLLSAPGEEEPEMFVIAVTLNPEAGLSPVDWNKKIFGTEHGLTAALPGGDNTFCYPETSPPAIAFQFSNLADPKIESYIGDTHDQNLINQYEEQRAAQQQLVDTLHAPNLGAAYMAILLVGAINKGSMSTERASTLLAEKFTHEGVGSHQAKEILRNAEMYTQLRASNSGISH